MAKKKRKRSPSATTKARNAAGQPHLSEQREYWYDEDYHTPAGPDGMRAIDGKDNYIIRDHWLRLCKGIENLRQLTGGKPIKYLAQQPHTLRPDLPLPTERVRQEDYTAALWFMRYSDDQTRLPHFDPLPLVYFIYGMPILMAGGPRLSTCTTNPVIEFLHQGLLPLHPKMKVGIPRW